MFFLKYAEVFSTFLNLVLEEKACVIASKWVEKDNIIAFDEKVL